VVASLKAAEGALAGSAVALQGASTGSTQLISATEGAVTGLRGVAHQLAGESESIRLILQESGVVIREAQKQAGVEKELTEGHRRLLEELQRVWPTLLDQYLKSFEEKSRSLASSWSDLHKNVGQLVDGTVSQLRDGAADLETAVDRLTKVLGTVKTP
jgi:ABC-type transporter Mla subunit MlaD